MERKPMDNTNEQEATDGAQVPAETSPATDTTVQDTDHVDASEASQETTQDTAVEEWKAHARTWERRTKADTKQLEELTAEINGKDTTIEELRSQVAALEAQAHRATHQQPGPTGVEGTGGSCRGAGGRWRGLAGQRADAPSEARSAGGSRAGHRPRAHTAARPDGARNTSAPQAAPVPT